MRKKYDECSIKEKKKERDRGKKGVCVYIVKFNLYVRSIKKSIFNVLYGRPSVSRSLLTLSSFFFRVRMRENPLQRQHKLNRW